MVYKECCSETKILGCASGVCRLISGTGTEADIVVMSTVYANVHVIYNVRTWINSWRTPGTSIQPRKLSRTSIEDRKQCLESNPVPPFVEKRLE